MAAGQGFKTFTTGEVLTAGDVNGYLMQGVLVFASAAARNAAITSPQEGQFAFTKDTNGLWYYDGAAWVASGATGDIEGVTAGVGISGGGTSGTVTITNSMATEITASGDIIVGTGSGTFDNLPIGTTGQILTADTTVSPYKVKWATAASGSSYVGCSAYKTSGQALTANAYTAITWQDEYWDTDAFHSSGTNPSRFTVPAGKAGKYAYKFNLGIGNTSGDVYFHVRINGTTYWNFSWDTNPPTNLQGDVTVNLAVGDYLELFVYFITAITTASYSEAICSFDYLGA
jgi:hypothetical protein